MNLDMDGPSKARNKKMFFKIISTKIKFKID